MGSGQYLVNWPIWRALLEVSSFVENEVQVEAGAEAEVEVEENCPGSLIMDAVAVSMIASQLLEILAAAAANIHPPTIPNYYILYGLPAVGPYRAHWQHSKATQPLFTSQQPFQSQEPNPPKFLS